MIDARENFRRWTDCLLDPTASPQAHRDAAHAWCEWGLARLGVNEGAVPSAGEAFFADTILAQGKAISPLGAARCIREQRRTAVFLQAMDTAIRTAIERFPGETIHVLEAGCGPLAPLALPFALRYAPERVVFTLLDLHPVALDGARKIVAALGLERSIRGYVATDATSVKFAPEDRPHVIACEVLLRALTREPQVAVTLNLAPQLRPGGVFVPEKIDVDAVLFDSGQWARAAVVTTEVASPNVPSSHTSITELGNVFSLNAGAVDRIEAWRSPEAGSEGTRWFRAKSVAVPAHNVERAPVRLFTRIQVLGAHKLGDFDSSLNLPSRVRYSEAIAERGGRLDFAYEASSDPGLRVVAVRGADGNADEPRTQGPVSIGGNGGSREQADAQT